MICSTTNRFIKRLFYGPVVDNYAPVKGALCHTKAGCPLCNGHGFPGVSDVVIAAYVFQLLFLRRPSYIARKISKVIVDSINSMLGGWFWANMFVKGGERRHPFRGNSYSPATIVTKMCGFGIRATLDHVIPCSVFGRSTKAMSVGRFNTKAPTALSVSVFQISALDNNCFSAFAKAFPSSFPSLGVFLAANNSESSKCLARKINKVFRCGHGVTSWLKVVVERVCWKAVNQFPLFGSYPIQHEVY